MSHVGPGAARDAHERLTCGACGDRGLHAFGSAGWGPAIDAVATRRTANLRRPGRK